MKSRFNSVMLIICACLFSMSVSASGPAPRDIQDLVGQRASNGERALESRGYVHISSQKGGDRSFGQWWNPSTRTCATVATLNGRYDTIYTSNPIDCNQNSGPSSGSDSGSNAAAVAVGAAILLGAIALSHKSSHHDDNAHSSDSYYEQEFERGHNDGLYNHHYDNHNNSDGYASGYTSGVEQRDHNTSYREHSGRYDRGYETAGVQTGEFSDLNGSRASSADSTLRQWGFNDVDSFDSSNTRYTIWYKRSTGQCIQMTTADGRAVDVRGIGTHPACR